MTENTSRSQTVHRWYTRPVFFVADVNRAARFYVETLGFEKGWHEGDGAGKVCQVNHGECEIILCEDATRRDRARLFIELTSEGLADLRREFVERSVPTKETWWGYDTLQVDDPDGNELLFLVRTEQHGKRSLTVTITGDGCLSFCRTPVTVSGRKRRRNQAGPSIRRSNNGTPLQSRA